MHRTLMSNGATRQQYGTDIDTMGATRQARVAVVCDLVEERWPSMDLVGDMLASQLAEPGNTSVHGVQVRPPMRRRLSGPMVLREAWLPISADRLLNRFVDYPRLLRRRRAEFDLFHVVDHSYSQLVHALPGERTVVTCHDLDTFRSLIEPDRERRGWLFRAMTRRVLAGMRKAAIVVCDTAAVRDELLAKGVITAERLRVVPLGIHVSCRAEPDVASDTEAARLLGPIDQSTPEILHVGSTIPRKEIEVLLRIVAAVRAARCSRIRLVRVGGPLTARQQALAERLGVTDAVRTLPFISREVLAAVYRRASLVLLPSSAEGFGLPVVEALACGTAVVASDLAVLREVGGSVAVYCPVGDVPAWCRVIVDLLSGEGEGRDARRQAAVHHASQFTWSAYSRRMQAIYAEVLAS
jgi:glycosyltransferase involved in cell wall biosynthesis